MTESQRAEVLHYRKQCHFPWHSPPHFGEEPDLYHITAACFEHRSNINTPDRLSSFESELIKALTENNIAEVRAWVVLPNHYHLLFRSRIPSLKKAIHRLHNKTATIWNREDETPGRKVWSPFADRRIRGDIHYYRTINYIHANPVKHGYTTSSREWIWSSFDHFENQYGRETLIDWWKKYPITGYGKGWDE